MRDPHELCFERGWTDGLPVVPPTPERVERMLAGCARDRDEELGLVPPALAPLSVEKAAINAVMAGCRPEYMPVVLTALEAALDPVFCLHGVLCTTCFSGPIVIVNGPVATRIGMNSGMNALGQGNRANATIGRALQLVVRNVGGGVPGGIDRSTLGQPGKYTFCFAEADDDPDWLPLSAARGAGRGASAVTLFAGTGVQGVWDEASRSPAGLVASLAASLRVAGNPGYLEYHDAVVVLSPEHYRIFRDAHWERGRIETALEAAVAERGVSRYRRGGIMAVRAGGPAGLMSGILCGWGGDSDPVTREVED